MRTLEISEELSSIVVWKFGGTSVGDHDRLRTVAERLVAAQRHGNRVVAVLSAMAGVHSRAATAMTSPGSPTAATKASTGCAASPPRQHHQRCSTTARRSA
jgi:aspartokinase